MNELQRLREDIETQFDKYLALRLRVSKCEAEERRKDIFKDGHYDIEITYDCLKIKNKIHGQTDEFHKDVSLPLLIRAVEEAKKRFNL